MNPPSAAPRHLLGALLVVLGRPVRFHIDARPGDRDQPVTTAATWPCGCSAAGPSYRDLLLTACDAHAAPAHDDPSAISSP